MHGALADDRLQPRRSRSPAPAVQRDARRQPGASSPAADHDYVNALDGHARGVEWLVQRQSPNGFSGWASYALGYATLSRPHDRGDVLGRLRPAPHGEPLRHVSRQRSPQPERARSAPGATSPPPATGTERGGTYFAGTERNTLSVPAYSRADVRANRTFTWDRKRLTLFVEAHQRRQPPQRPICAAVGQPPDVRCHRPV